MANNLTIARAPDTIPSEALFMAYPAGNGAGDIRYLCSPRDSFTAGRDMNCDYIYADGEVSGLMCLVALSANRYPIVYDLGRNGVRLAHLRQPNGTGLISINDYGEMNSQARVLASAMKGPIGLVNSLNLAVSKKGISDKTESFDENKRVRLVDTRSGKYLLENLASERPIAFYDLEQAFYDAQKVIDRSPNVKNAKPTIELILSNSSSKLIIAQTRLRQY